MGSVINEAESFESAPVAAARERMVTACNVPASVAIALCGQTTWNACVSIARRPLAAAPCSSCKMKVHLSPHCNELFTNGLHSSTTAGRGRATGKVPRRGVGECAIEMYLHPPQPTHSTPYLSGG